jgi:hypothetical protein
MEPGSPVAKLMPRRTKIIIIKAEEGKEIRDAGKSFLITETSAVQAEEWGLRAIMALGTSGFVVPQEMADAGLIGLALLGYSAFMGASEAAVLPLWREMLPTCVQYKAPLESASGADILMPWSPSLVEEVSTLLLLRKQIVELHTGFTLAELAQKLRQASSARQSMNSPATSTFQE